MPAATDRDRALKLARRRQGVTTRELAEAGIHTQILSRLVAGGELERIARGLYRVPEHAVTEHHGLAIAAAAPRTAGSVNPSITLLRTSPSSRRRRASWASAR